ncbi:MAG: hypothetical protein ACRDM7_20445 [Thermoleophilaceae bacterium]
MKRFALLTTPLAAAVSLVAVLVASAGADHPGSQTLTFVERNNQGTFRFVDNPPKFRGRGEPSVSAGDMFLGSSPLYNAANTQRAGRLFFKCTAVVGNRRFERSSFLCEAIAKLRNGELALDVLFKGSDPSGAVTGGTGAYEGASGSFTSDERRRTSVDTFHFDTD